MKHIIEAIQDEKFNTEMAKIQKSIEKLMQLSQDFSDHGIRPVNSQRYALTSAAEDLAKIRSIMFNS